MPVSVATSPLTIRCIASLGGSDGETIKAEDSVGGASTKPKDMTDATAYLDWVEHEAKVVSRTQPILGVPLTSIASTFRDAGSHFAVWRVFLPILLINYQICLKSLLL